MKKQYVLFIGIDISMDWYDVAIGLDGEKENMVHQRFNNKEKGFEKMLKWIEVQRKKWGIKGPCLFVMEHTGVYTLALCRFLEEKELDYVLESALRIKRSLGIKRGKDDKADSKDISRYAYLHRKGLKVTKLPSKSLLKLKNLLAYRARLVKHRAAHKVASNDLKKFMLKGCGEQEIVESSKELIKDLDAKINWVEKEMQKVIGAEDELKRTYDLIESVKGVGEIIATNMIVYTNCFKAFKNYRKFACYIGIAPFAKSSGKSLDMPAKVSQLGYKKLKTLLGNGVNSAIQYDKELKAYYNRRIEEGKNKYKVLNAVKNKLLSRIFAVVNRGTPYVAMANYR